MKRTQSMMAEIFWHTHGLPRWEQIVFSIINIPLTFVTLVLGLCLYVPLRLLKFIPFLHTLLASLAYFFLTLTLANILFLSVLTQNHPVLRPVTFLLALPFLIFNYNLTVFSFNSGVFGNRNSVMKRLDLLEAFPYTSDLFSEFQTDRELFGCDPFES